MSFLGWRFIVVEGQKISTCDWNRCEYCCQASSALHGWCIPYVGAQLLVSGAFHSRRVHFVRLEAKASVGYWDFL